MANERMANDFDNRGGKKRKRKDKKKRKVHPLRSYFRNSLHGVAVTLTLTSDRERGINNTVRSARARMFNLGLTHDQVAAAKERAEKSVWNYFKSDHAERLHVLCNGAQPRARALQQGAPCWSFPGKRR
mmetsp:Transcript_55672/g.133411  ORF Transcript_55672/g.133411 Transcript_55672/m.133411 type:complete len:129 (-) Transcript_55672:85-471(-)